MHHYKLDRASGALLVKTILKGGIIKGRPRKYNEEQRLLHNKQIDRFRVSGLTDRDIAKRLGVSYFTVAERSMSETNY